jgi:hypothetical protein
MDIRLDLGNVPSVLAALANPLTMQRGVNAAAESFVDNVLDWIAAGKSFTAHHGQAGLEGAIGWQPSGEGSAMVYVNKNYAEYVESGTRPHVIKPKPGRKGLKIPVSGGSGFIVRRAVNHPGSKPYPYFFADLDMRIKHMESAMLSILAQAASSAQE